MFKKYDKVVVDKVVYFYDNPQWEELVGRTFVITEINKTKGLPNSYSLDEVDKGKGYAWIWENQLVLESECDFDLVKINHDKYLDIKRKEQEDRNNEFKEAMNSDMSQKQKEVLMMLHNPFAYAMFKSVQDSIKKIRGGKYGKESK